MEPLIDLDVEICQDPAIAESLEWLIADGSGGFASSTVKARNTRKYHGLLILPVKAPWERRLLLAGFEETLVKEDREYLLSTPSESPGGESFLVNFRLDPFPVFTYFAGECELEKRIFMPRGKNAVIVRYRVLEGEGECHIRVSPFITSRNIHEVREAAAESVKPVEPMEENIVRYRLGEDLPELCFIHNAPKVRIDNSEWRSFEYPREKDRGYESMDALLRAGEFLFKIAPEKPGHIIATINENDPGEPILSEREETRRIENLLKRVNPYPAGWKKKDSVLPLLVNASDTFVVKEKDAVSVIAGYPWFYKWVRDSLISIQGLLLEPGRFEEARNLLLSLLKHYKDGLIPVTFSEKDGTPLYHSADTSLWFIQAVYQYYNASHDIDSIRMPLYDSVKDIINQYIRGTRYGIKQDEDGLIAAGEPGVALTWMDAHVEGQPVTPRSGKCVEINALWYNALRIAAFLADLLDDEEAFTAYEMHAERVKQSFEKTFWNETGQGLYDRTGEDGRPDPSIRPNQIFAISLSFPVLPEDKAGAVLKCIDRFLLTPYGLRTLAPGHPDYKTSCRGNIVARDHAYHQGTVWPWLIGPYIDALIRYSGENPELAKKAMENIKPLLERLEQDGLGSVSEVFDAEPPHRPGGCFAQAWSVSELLRIYVKLQRILPLM